MLYNNNIIAQHHHSNNKPSIYLSTFLHLSSFIFQPLNK